MNQLLEETTFWSAWEANSSEIRDVVREELKLCILGANKAVLFPRDRKLPSNAVTHKSDILEEYLVLLLRGYACKLTKDGLEARSSVWYHDRVGEFVCGLLQFERELCLQEYATLTGSTGVNVVYNGIVASSLGTIVSMLYDFDDPSLPITYPAGKVRLFGVLLDYIVRHSGEEVKTVIFGLISLDIVEHLKPPRSMDIKRLEVRDVTMRMLKQHQYNMVRESAEGFGIFQQNAIHLMQNCPYNNAVFTVQELTYRGLLGVGDCVSTDYEIRKRTCRNMQDVDEWAETAIVSSKTLYDQMQTTIGSYKINMIKAQDMMQDVFECVVYSSLACPAKHQDLYLKIESNPLGNPVVIGNGLQLTSLPNNFPGFVMLHPMTPVFLLFQKKMSKHSLIQLLSWKLSSRHITARQQTGEELAKQGYQSTGEAGTTPLSFISILSLLVYTGIITIEDISHCLTPDHASFTVECEKRKVKQAQILKGYKTISLVDETEQEVANTSTIEDTTPTEEPFFACIQNQSSLMEMNVRDTRYGLLCCLFALQTAEISVTLNSHYKPIDAKTWMQGEKCVSERFSVPQYTAEMSPEQQDMISMGLAAESTQVLHHTYTPTSSVVDYLPGLNLYGRNILQSYYKQMYPYIATCEYIDMHPAEPTEQKESRIQNSIFGQIASPQKQQLNNYRTGIFLVGNSGLFAACVTSRVSVFVDSVLSTNSKNPLNSQQAQLIMQQLPVLLFPVKDMLSQQPNIFYRLLQCLKVLIIAMNSAKGSVQNVLPSNLAGSFDLKEMPLLSNILLECVFPSYSLSPGSVMLSKALWSVMCLLSAQDRYSLYSAWELYVYPSSVDLEIVQAQSVRRAKFIRKRMAVGKMAELMRSAHQYMYSNPLPCLWPFLEHVKMMSSVVSPVEEMLSILPPMHVDCVLYYICRMFSEGIADLKREDGVGDQAWVGHTSMQVAGLLTVSPEDVDLSVLQKLITKQARTNTAYAQVLHTLLSVAGCQVDILDGDQDATLLRCGGPILASYASPSQLLSKEKLYRQNDVLKRLFRAQQSKTTKPQTITIGNLNIITAGQAAILTTVNAPSVPVPISCLYLRKELQPYIHDLFITLGRLEQDVYHDSTDSYFDLYEKILQTIRLYRCFLETYMLDVQDIPKYIPNLYELVVTHKVRTETALNLLQPWLHVESVFSIPADVLQSIQSKHNISQQEYESSKSMQIVPYRVYVLFLCLFPECDNPEFRAWRFYKAAQRINLRDVYQRKSKEVTKQLKQYQEELAKLHRTKTVPEGQVEGAIKLTYGDLVVLLTLQVHVLEEQESGQKKEESRMFNEGKKAMNAYSSYLEKHAMYVDARPSVLRKEAKEKVDETLLVRHVCDLMPIEASKLFTHMYIIEYLIPAIRFSTSNVVMLTRLQRECLNQPLIHPVVQAYRVMLTLPSMFAISSQQEIQRLAVYIQDILTSIRMRIVTGKPENGYVLHNHILTSDTRVYPSVLQDQTFLLDQDVLLTSIVTSALQSMDMLVMQTCLYFTAKIVSIGSIFPMVSTHIKSIESLIQSILNENGHQPVIVQLCKQVLGGCDKCKNGMIKTTVEIQAEAEEEERLVQEEMERLGKEKEEEKKRMQDMSSNSKKSSSDETTMHVEEETVEKPSKKVRKNKSRTETTSLDNNSTSKTDNDGEKLVQLGQGVPPPHVGKQDDTSREEVEVLTKVTTSTDTNAGPTYSRHQQFKQQQQQQQQRTTVESSTIQIDNTNNKANTNNSNTNTTSGPTYSKHQQYKQQYSTSDTSSSPVLVSQDEASIPVSRTSNNSNNSNSNNSNSNNRNITTARQPSTSPPASASTNNTNSRPSFNRDNTNTNNYHSRERDNRDNNYKDQAQQRKPFNQDYDGNNREHGNSGNWARNNNDYRHNNNEGNNTHNNNNRFKDQNNDNNRFHNNNKDGNNNRRYPPRR